MRNFRLVAAFVALCAAFPSRAAETDLSRFLPASARCALCIRVDRLLRIPSVETARKTPAGEKFLQDCELDYGIRASDVREVLVSADADGRNVTGAFLFSSDERLNALLREGTQWLRPEKNGNYFIDLEGTTLSGFLFCRAAPSVALCRESGSRPEWGKGDLAWYRKGKHSGALAWGCADLAGSKRLPSVLEGVKSARAELWENGKELLLKSTVSCRSAEDAGTLQFAIRSYYALGCSLLSGGDQKLAAKLQQELKLAVSGAELSLELTCDPWLLYRLLAPFLDMAVRPPEGR